ncbi:MAG: tyrosine-type recombinase/integrase [Acutalibacteraceae bacterium]
MIIINAQLTFENLCNYSCKNAKGNVIKFPILKAKNNELKSNFTSQGKPKAQPADSVKTLEEIEKIKKYFLDRKEYRNYCLFIVGITTGYRCGDLLSLKFSDFFDEDYSWKREIDIVEQKTKKRRKMPISGSIKNALNLYIRQIGYFELDEYVFKSQKGKNKPIGISPMRSIFNKMAIDLKLPYHCSTHFLRKTFAYWFLQVHKNDMTTLATLQDILNHSSEKMTLKYCGIEKERKEQMLKSLENLW